MLIFFKSIEAGVKFYMLWNHRCLKHYYREVKILEDWKIKISVLWLIYEVAGLASAVLAIFEPDLLKDFLNTGELEGMKITPEFLLVFAIILLIPLVMAFLSLTLKDSTNRWANIIVGIVWIGLGLTDLPKYVTEPSAYAILMWLSTIVALALIVWYAWKSKQQA